MSQGNAMLADASGPCTSANSGSEILKSTGSWCRYLKMAVDSTEKNGSVAITLPPGLSFASRTVKKRNWAFSDDATHW